MMDDLIISFLVIIFQFFVTVCVFSALLYVIRYVYNKLKEAKLYKQSRFFNPLEYLPIEEYTTIRQVYYLAMITIIVMCILYSLFSWDDESFNFLILDIIISIYLAIEVEWTSFKNKLILFLLVPWGALAFYLFDASLVIFLDLIHFTVFFYFIREYYRKFIKYTEENRLGITIMLLFAIVFLSFLITIIVEDVSPLESMNMVSNAFTSNGYTILGRSGVGKINAIFLVWSGFILSGVGTATLTVAIVMSHVNRKFDRLEDLVKKNKK